MKTILFQGDSITDAGRDKSGNPLPPGAGLGVGYPLLVAARLLCDQPGKWNIVNKAISGNRVVDLYARWKIDTLKIKPDILSIMIGVNDTWHEKGSGNGVEVPRYERIYRELLQWTKDTLPNIQFVLLEPYVHVFGAVADDWVDEIKQRQDVVKKLAKEFNAIFIPSQAILDKALAKAPQDHWTADGVHPRLAGHQLFADAWLKAVLNY